MNDDIQIRINTVIKILAGESTKANKVIASFQALTGMDITHFADKKKNSVYEHLLDVNKITAQYPGIKTYEDYKNIRDVHLNKMLKSVQRLCLRLLID